MSAGGKDRITLAHTLDEQHPVHLAMERFRDTLIRLSGATMAVEIFPNAQLGTERELVELVQLGAISMTKVSSLSLENFAPDMGVYSLPYLFDDSEHQRRVVQSEIGQEILDGLGKILLKGIGHYDAGSRSFYMTGGPVNTPDDIRGKTVRVLPSEALVKTIEIFGGAATPIAFGELYAALQQGVVDGAENNPPSLLSARHHEVCKYFSLDEHVSAPDVVVMSQSIWDKLDAQQRDWVKQSMADSEAYQRELWRKASDDALAEIEASGVIINRPDKAPFRAAVGPLRASYDGTRIGDFARRIEAMAGDA
ncbi:TRAP transporter substrate-binding protein [Altererythrobacter sp. GH1-8]|uniref:TRAP transporter substrate-binding protein n=1 Tax=Altererythrobacter sp. GH1-8 TaxID=3349333 RepID=UPI00374CE74D